MRTVGTFQDIYTDAKNYYNGISTYGGCPINPVVRHERGRWIIESDLEPEDETNDLSCPLEDFDSYFYEMYDTDFMPNNNDAEEFRLAMTDEED